MAVSLQISTGEAREGKLSELITFQARNTILSSTLLIRYRLKVSVINRACFSFKYSQNIKLLHDQVAKKSSDSIRYKRTKFMKKMFLLTRQKNKNTDIVWKMITMMMMMINFL